MIQFPASKELSAWLRATATNQVDFAKRLNVKQSTVSSWKTERSRPEPHLRPVIALITGIDEDHWLTADERKERDALLKAASKKAVGS